MDEKCDICGKKATVHLTQIVNGDVLKAELCDTCAQTKGILSKHLIALPSDLLKLVIPHQETGSDLSATCSACGFSAAEFKRVGRAGCPECYENLKQVIKPVLETVHPVLEHKGKVPAQAINRVSLQKQLADLEDGLKSAIKEERYEEAANLRDAIKQAKLEASHEK